MLLLATAGILLVTTLLPQLDPDLNIVMRDRTLDVALSALTFVAVAGLAVLTYAALSRDRTAGVIPAVVGIRLVGDVQRWPRCC